MKTQELESRLCDWADDIGGRIFVFLVSAAFRLFIILVAIPVLFFVAAIINPIGLGGLAWCGIKRIIRIESKK